MQDILRNNPEDKKQKLAWVYGLGLAVCISTGMFMGAGGDIDPKDLLLVDPFLLLLLQGVFAIIIFISIPIIFNKVALKIPINEFFPKISLATVGLTALITISFMIVNSAVGEWNMNLDFGNSDWAEWARKSEEQAKVKIEHLTSFTSISHFILTFVVIAIIPAIGEELLFRGLIQNLFSRAFGNHHVAIWVTGFVFAAIHLQFFGMMPRMFLGVLFGYLYHWSGKLSVAMIGHLVNNGLVVIILYLTQTDIIKVTPEQMEEVAPWPAVLFFAVISFFLIRIFHKKF